MEENADYTTHHTEGSAIRATYPSGQQRSSAGAGGAPSIGPPGLPQSVTDTHDDIYSLAGDPNSTPTEGESNLPQHSSNDYADYCEVQDTDVSTHV